jgi:hypothetical protein
MQIAPFVRMLKEHWLESMFAANCNQIGDPTRKRRTSQHEVHVATPADAICIAVQRSMAS